MIQSEKRARKQTGSVLVLATAGLLLMLVASALSVDAGYFFVVKGQMQNAVDAATLAGAQGLIADPGNFSYDGQAMQLAIQVAAKNNADAAPVILSPAEITFPNGQTIRIAIIRPVPTFFARVFGVSQVNARVVAAAVVAPVNAVGGGPAGGGMRPWAILDQFGHGGLCVPPNDEEVNSQPHGPFNDQPHQWMGITAVDHYTSPYDPAFEGWDLSNEPDCGNVTGLIAPRDITGELIRLKQFGGPGGNGNGNGNGNGHGNGGGGSPWITPGNFGAIALGGRGAANYRDNIANGYDGTVGIGDVIDTEPGNMVGPTLVGVSELIAMDPGARMIRNSQGYWVVSSDVYPLNESPRIVPIPLYSVYNAPANGRSNFTVSAIASFFIEATDGFNVWGKFVQTRVKNSEPATLPTNAGNQSVAGGGRFLATVQMIDPDQLQ